MMGMLTGYKQIHMIVGCLNRGVNSNPWAFEGNWWMTPLDFWGLPTCSHPDGLPKGNGDVDGLGSPRRPLLLPGTADLWKPHDRIVLHFVCKILEAAFRSTAENVSNKHFSNWILVGNFATYRIQTYLFEFGPAAQFGWRYGCGGIPHAGGRVGESLGTFAGWESGYEPTKSQEDLSD